MTRQNDQYEAAKCKVLRNARLQNIEDYMHITPDDDDNIYNRIKNIENRILMLESTSPEYKYNVSTHFTIISMASLIEFLIFLDKIRNGFEEYW